RGSEIGFRISGFGGWGRRSWELGIGSWGRGCLKALGESSGGYWLEEKKDGQNKRVEDDHGPWGQEGRGGEDDDGEVDDRDDEADDCEAPPPRLGFSKEEVGESGGRKKGQDQQQEKLNHGIRYTGRLPSESSRPPKGSAS